MKKLSTLIALALALATTASAASAGAPAAEGPVSQINGTPIKVGEHNEYYYAPPKTNISINPIGPMVGIYNVSTSYALSNTVAIRGDFNIFHRTMDSDLEAFEVGIGFPIYFKQMYQGFFIEPGAIVRGSKSVNDNNVYVESDTMMGPQVLAGYTARWDSGFNTSIAFGMGRDISDDQNNAIFGNGYFRVGYAF